MAKPPRKAARPPAPEGKKRPQGAERPGPRDPRRAVFDIDFDPAAQLRPAAPEPLPMPKGLRHDAGPEVLNRLWTIIEIRRNADPGISHSARLMAKGTARVARKFGEEAVECLIEAVAGNRLELIGESADVLYHLLVMLVDARIRPEEVWQELEKREGVSRMAEGSGGALRKLVGKVNIGTGKIP